MREKTLTPKRYIRVNLFDILKDVIVRTVQIFISAWLIVFFQYNFEKDIIFWYNTLYASLEQCADEIVRFFNFSHVRRDYNDKNIRQRDF